MPELPEVETVVRTLGPLVAGRRVIDVMHVRGDMVRPADFDLAAALRLRTVTAVDRRAKRIVLTLDSAERFYVHLGMTGRLTVEDHALPPAKHTHLVLRLDNGRDVRLVDPRRFGEIVWLGRLDHGNVGPEPLTLRPTVLIKRLSKTKRAIKAALLDQTVIAGIGNIYADEALHRAGVHPAKPANRLSGTEVVRLSRAIKGVLRKAIASGGSSIRDYVDAEGKKGGFQLAHRVYDREGEPCRECRRPIVRIVLGGRSTHFCENCQRADITSGADGRLEPTSKSRGRTVSH